MKKPTHNTKKFGAKIQEYKDKEQSDMEASELVKNELQQANTILGNTDVEGEGIVITLRETNTEETGIINANDLLDIVNELKNAVDTQNHSVFLIKYKNLLEEINNL